MIIEGKVLSYYNLSLTQDVTILKIFMTYYMLKVLLTINRKIEFKEKQKNIIITLGKASTMIYFLHMFLKRILDVYRINPYFEWISIIIIITTLTFIINKLGKNQYVNI